MAGPRSRRNSRGRFSPALPEVKHHTNSDKEDRVILGETRAMLRTLALAAALLVAFSSAALAGRRLYLRTSLPSEGPSRTIQGSAAAAKAGLKRSKARSHDQPLVSKK